MFDGEGSFKYGGRWSSPGTRVVYTAESLALATLEIVVHFDEAHLRADYSFATATFSEKLVLNIEDFAGLPKNWRESPPPIAIQEIGDAWAESMQSVVLRVPTSLIPEGENFLLNVGHKEFRNVVLGDPQLLSLDKRLLD